jgi:hypothetical protein
MTRYWFRPKRYGYGATPTTWEGWAFTGLIVAILAVGALLPLRNGHGPGGTTALLWWAFVADRHCAHRGGREIQDLWGLAVAMGTRLIGPGTRC